MILLRDHGGIHQAGLAGALQLAAVADLGLLKLLPSVEKLGARLDLDLPSLAGRPFRGLSGGMKQKLLVALALASEPALLILDEPTGSLDARSRERFFGLFEELADDVTVILCSHRLEEVQQLVDHVLVLEEGRLVYDGHASGFLEMNSGGGDGDGPA